MSFVSANDHPNPISPQDPLYYAPRSVRSIADPRSNSMQQTRSDSLPPASSLSRFEEMSEEAFAKYTRPLDSRLVHERRPSRALLATIGGITAAIGVTVVVALLFLNGFPKPKSDPSEVAVSISTPESRYQRAVARGRRDRGVRTVGFVDHRGLCSGAGKRGHGRTWQRPERSQPRWARAAA